MAVIQRKIYRILLLAPLSLHIYIYIYIYFPKKNMNKANLINPLAVKKMGDVGCGGNKPKKSRVNET